ncbi:hypothetical protein ACFQU9_37615 [Actinomadura namibiensis]|uniref:hypothetical protein n=1 Tax=Actinomadura kijaniata TaxID=46161 RepID=UPI00360E6917
MDEIERRVAERLARIGGAPPPGLHGRVVTAARDRRRRRRRVALLGAAAGAAATALVPAVVLTAGSGSRTSPATAVTPARDTVISRALPGGQRLRAMALGSDGSVLGVPATVDAERVRVTQRGVWVAGPGRAARRVADTGPDSLPYLWTMAAGRAAYVWPDGTRLRCLPPGGGEVTTLRPGWDGRDRFYSDGDAVVWWDADRKAPATSLGCAGAVRDLSVKGTLAAFSFPHAYVRSGRTMRQVDVVSGRQTTITLPDGREPSAGFGAGPDTLAWADRNVLTVRSLSSRPSRREVRGLPHGGDDAYLGRVTVGEHVVVFSAVHQDLDDASSLVHDLRTGKSTTVPGEAWAACPYLLRQEGDGYRLTRP